MAKTSQTKWDPLQDNKIDLPSAIASEPGEHAEISTRRPKRELVIVAGMHRSGTSAMTRVLSLLGCAPPHTLLPAQDNDNDKGFWESKPVMELNNNILLSIGSDWDGWDEVDEHWFSTPIAAEFAKTAADLLESEFEGAPLAVLKDPRICRLMPFWLNVANATGYQPRIVIPVRHPLEVSESLHKRNKISVALTQLIWLRHVLDAEYNSRAYPRSFVTYDLLMKDWRALASKVQADLDLKLPRTSMIAEDDVDAFLDPALYRNRLSETDLLSNTFVPQWTRDTFDIMQRWSTGDEREGDAERLTEIRTAFNEASHTFSRIIHEGRKAHRNSIAVTKERDELVAKLALQKQQAEDVQAELQARIETADAERDELVTELESQKRQAEDIQTELQAHIETANAERDELVTELESQKRQAEDAQAELQAHIETAGAERDELVTELESQKRQAEDIQAELQAHIETAESTVQAWTTKTAALTEKSTHLEAEIAEAGTRLASANDTIETLKSENNKLVVKLNDTSTMLHEQRNALARSQSDLAQAEMTIQKDKDEHAMQLRALNDNLQKLERQLDERFQEIAKLTKILHQSESQNAEFAIISRSLLNTTLKLADIPNIPILNRLPMWRRLRERRLRTALVDSGLFDSNWYRQNYDDVEASGIDPALHFAVHGIHEGRKPNSYL